MIHTDLYTIPYLTNYIELQSISSSSYKYNRNNNEIFSYIKTLSTDMQYGTQLTNHHNQYYYSNINKVECFIDNQYGYNLPTEYLYRNIIDTSKLNKIHIFITNTTATENIDYIKS
ncbi:unnamed protein product [Didymodactylos carnosus]|uniref:Uncharacterized protein n=1 Tax=Didymodactylos carnosus TaxID=1234261 RepID=A0A8S2FYI4_9BILA|nr:unnamed protein product [Didymodactylos carnosus]CAF4394771.1 unnamed protein product [Didymodactylos carnosus]